MYSGGLIQLADYINANFPTVQTYEQFLGLPLSKWDQKLGAHFKCHGGSLLVKGFKLVGNNETMGLPDGF